MNTQLVPSRDLACNLIIHGEVLEARPWATTFGPFGQSEAWCLRVYHKEGVSPQDGEVVIEGVIPMKTTMFLQ
jgi:hypothetical protein